MLRAESGPIFNFNMSENKPEQKDYIMDRLVVPVGGVGQRVRPVSRRTTCSNKARPRKTVGILLAAHDPNLVMCPGATAEQAWKSADKMICP
jgi:hypothetical protein